MKTEPFSAVKTELLPFIGQIDLVSVARSLLITLRNLRRESLYQRQKLEQVGERRYMSTVLFQDDIQTIVENKNTKNDIDRRVFGSKVGLVAKLFGCWHEDISRPFVEGKTAYRACLKCGARKQFDPKNLRTFGGFYYPPVVKRIENL